MGFGTCRCEFKKSRVCALWWGWRCFLQLSRLSKRRTCICLRTERILVSTIQPIPLHFPKLVYLAGSINTQQLGMLCHWLTGVCKSHRSPFFLTSPSCYLQSLVHFLFSIEQNVVLVAACILTVRLFSRKTFNSKGSTDGSGNSRSHSSWFAFQLSSSARDTGAQHFDLSRNPRYMMEDSGKFMMRRVMMVSRAQYGARGKSWLREEDEGDVDISSAICGSSANYKNNKCITPT